MAKTARLTVLTGPHRGRRFCFRGASNCLVGRGSDCFMRFAGFERDLEISRHHCKLEVDPGAEGFHACEVLNGGPHLSI